MFGFFFFFLRKRRGAINSKQLTYLEKYRPKQRLRFKDPHNHKIKCCLMWASLSLTATEGINKKFVDQTGLMPQTRLLLHFERTSFLNLCETPKCKGFVNSGSRKISKGLSFTALSVAKNGVTCMSTHKQYKPATSKICSTKSKDNLLLPLAG